jgi:hypothetical protein
MDQDLGSRIWGFSFRAMGVGCILWDMISSSGFGVKDLRFRFKDLWFTV